MPPSARSRGRWIGVAAMLATAAFVAWYSLRPPSTHVLDPALFADVAAVERVEVIDGIARVRVREDAFAGLTEAQRRTIATRIFDRVAGHGVHLLLLAHPGGGYRVDNVNGELFVMPEAP